MKTIGLLGGLSWESSAVYYQIINETVKAKLGGLHSARCLLYSFDFAEIEVLQRQGDWQMASDRMVAAAQKLKRGGAEGLVICSNTMHKMADAVEDALDIPLLHIVDATAEVIVAQGLTKVGLLGTRFTMEQEFYTQRLQTRYGLQVCVPDEPGRAIAHQIIYEELCQGIFKPESKHQYQQLIEQLTQQGATGIILGCTEIGSLIQPDDVSVPIFDTTRIHAEAAVNWAIARD